MVDHHVDLDVGVVDRRQAVEAIGQTGLRAPHAENERGGGPVAFDRR